MLTRRQIMQYGAAGAAGGALSGCTMRALSADRGQARAAVPNDKLLFVIAAAGGASVMDSFLPAIKQASTPADLNAYDASLVDQGPGDLRAVKDIPYTLGIPVGPDYSMIDFLTAHGADTAVVTQTVSSVNHLIAAERALNGNNANKTRTVMEAVAAQYGAGHLFPNVNMATLGYATAGLDDTLPAFAAPTSIADAQLFPLATHGYRGVQGAPTDALMARARQVRGDVEAASPFAQGFKASPALVRYLADRNATTQLEAANLIQRLMLIDEARQGIPLSKYGLSSSDEIAVLEDSFPGLATGDPFHAQAALAFLMGKYGISSAITIGMSNDTLITGTSPNANLVELPLAFDWSHNNHRGAQNSMWRRLLQVTDNLIKLLKTADYLGDPANGKVWDRSLIYIATEFGRTKNTQGEMGPGSAHDMNNGSVLVSPLIKGGRVYGGIDAATGLTYGFDVVTGVATPGETMAEKHVYGIVTQALGVEFEGQVSVPAVVRG